MKKTKSLCLATTGVGKLFVIYAVPSILSMIILNTATLIDSLFVGNFVGPEGIAGITIITPLLNFFNGATFMIGVGGATLCGIFKGAGDKNKSDNYFNVTMILVGVITLLFSLLSIFGYKIIPLLFKLDSQVGVYAEDYLFILGFFLLPWLYSMIFNLFLKLGGRPFTVVIVTIISLLINVLLDYIFIAGLRLEVKGAAFATGISALVPFMLYFITIIRSKIWQIKLPVFKLNEIKNIFFNGSSEFLNMTAVALTGFIYNSIILQMIGERGVSAYGIGLQLKILTIFLFWGIADAVHAPLCFNFGAENFSRVKKFKQLSLSSATLIGLIIAVMTLFFREPIAGFFVDDLETISHTKTIFFYFALSFLFMGANVIMSSFYTALSQPILSILIALMRSFIVPVFALMLVFCFLDARYIWLPLVLAEVATFVIACYLNIKYPFGRRQIFAEN